MKNKGKIYAVEMNARRFDTLQEMAQGTNATIIQTVLQDVLQTHDEDVPNVEYILLDPSCSGSGIANRFASDGHKDSSRLYKLSGLQFKLLIHAMTSFPNVKRIVYSTCSIYPEENEEVVLSCLQKVGNFKLANVGDLLKNQWNNFGDEKTYPGLGSKVIYARMDNDKSDMTNGFFVSVLERCEEDEFNEFYLKKQQNLEVHSEKFGKRQNPDADQNDNDNENYGVNENGENAENAENEDVKPKKKKKWINKGFNQ